VLRELAHVLSSQGRHAEAERFARDAYSIAPTNAFIIDILCEVIIGKETDEQLRSNEEIEKLLNELKALGTAQGLSFYNERMALRYLKLGEHDKAWAHANESVVRSPRHFGPHATRIRIALQLRRFEKFKEDLESLAGKGETEGRANRFIVDRAKIAYAIARGDLVEAKALLDKAQRLPRFVREELEGQLKKLVANTANADPLLAKWSQKKTNTRKMSGQARRPQTRPPRK
jgi:tetratricopeptide (TPR) repeat protein